MSLTVSRRWRSHPDIQEAKQTTPLLFLLLPALEAHEYSKYFRKARAKFGGPAGRPVGTMHGTYVVYTGTGTIRLPRTRAPWISQTKTEITVVFNVTKFCFSNGNVFFSVFGFLHRSFLWINRDPTNSHGT